MNGHLRPTLLGRLKGFDLKIKQNKLNPGSIAFYYLWPGNGVVAILAEREGMDKEENR